jgi:hypothetical protein
MTMHKDRLKEIQRKMRRKKKGIPMYVDSRRYENDKKTRGANAMREICDYRIQNGYLLRWLTKVI